MFIALQKGLVRIEDIICVMPGPIDFYLIIRTQQGFSHEECYLSRADRKERMDFLEKKLNGYFKQKSSDVLDKKKSIKRKKKSIKRKKIK